MVGDSVRVAGCGDQVMSVSAHDVAAELRRRFGDLGVVKLHKLLYYAQGCHLVWAGEPLFEERIEAWVNGPVVARLWRDEKHDHPRPAPAVLTGEQLATVDYVVDRYGRFSGKELIRATHLEDPWRDVSESDDPFLPADPEIGLDALRRWFEQDDELSGQLREAERLRRRRDVHSFEPLPRTADLEASVARTAAGERVRDRQGS